MIKIVCYIQSILQKTIFLNIIKIVNLHGNVTKCAFNLNHYAITIGLSCSLIEKDFFVFICTCMIVILVVLPNQSF
jgi:hypothetical protein